MNADDPEVTAQLQTLERLGAQLLEQSRHLIGPDFRQGPGLLLHNPLAPCPKPETFALGANALELVMDADPEDALIRCRNMPVARASRRSLPLQSDCFGLVILSHLIGIGDESELEEACRILRADGFLLILGLNRYGLRRLTGRSEEKLPGMRALAIRQQLEQLDMEIFSLIAAGFLGGERPRQMIRGPARILIPLADLFLLIARPVAPRIMNPLSESKVRAVGVPSAMVGS
jgi:SAM-dependent methyltransferase